MDQGRGWRCREPRTAARVGYFDDRAFRLASTLLECELQRWPGGRDIAMTMFPALAKRARSGSIPAVDARPLAALTAAYGLGSIPFAFLAVRILKGVDIRSVGSGNVGATNAGRVLGRPAAIAIYLLDAAKGAAAVWIGRALSSGDPSVEAGCGLLAIVGHVFPVWLRFRGGKGVATTTGVFAALVPAAFALAGGVWIVVAGATRYVSLASIALAVALPIAVIGLAPERAFGSHTPITALAAAAGLFVAVKHRANVRRVLEGTEPRIGERRAAPPPEGGSDE